MVLLPTLLRKEKHLEKNSTCSPLYNKQTPACVPIYPSFPPVTMNLLLDPFQSKPLPCSVHLISPTDSRTSPQQRSFLSLYNQVLLSIGLLPLTCTSISLLHKQASKPTSLSLDIKLLSSYQHDFSASFPAKLSQQVCIFCLCFLSYHFLLTIRIVFHLHLNCFVKVTY